MPTKFACGLLGVAQHVLRFTVSWVRHQGNRGRGRYETVEQLQSLGAQNRIEEADPGDVATGSVVARDIALSDGVAPVGEHDWNAGGGCFGSLYRVAASRRCN